MAPKSNDDPNPTQENDSTLNESETDDERMDAEEAEQPEEEDVDEEALEEFEETKEFVELDKQLDALNSVLDMLEAKKRQHSGTNEGNVRFESGGKRKSQTSEPAK